VELVNKAMAKHQEIGVVNNELSKVQSGDEEWLVGHVQSNLMAKLCGVAADKTWLR
jgi:hypothetical protein